MLILYEYIVTQMTDAAVEALCSKCCPSCKPRFHIPLEIVSANKESNWKQFQSNDHRTNLTTVANTESIMILLERLDKEKILRRWIYLSNKQSKWVKPMKQFTMILILHSAIACPIYVIRLLNWYPENFDRICSLLSFWTNLLFVQIGEIDTAKTYSNRIDDISSVETDYSIHTYVWV